MIFQLGIDVERTQSNTIIVRVEAENLAQAQEFAITQVREVCRKGAVNNRICYGVDWRDARYYCDGTSAEDYSDMEEWDADIDLTKAVP